jgi:hypothetical protein
MTAFDSFTIGHALLQNRIACSAFSHNLGLSWEAREVLKLILERSALGFTSLNLVNRKLDVTCVLLLHYRNETNKSAQARGLVEV